MKRQLALALLAAALTHACEAEKDEPSAAHHVHRELPGESIADLSIYQLEGDWTDASGAAAPLSRLAGSPVLLLMFYGTCDYACPLLVHDLQRVEELLDPGTREQVRFVLVTFDPERDTPEKLASYARELELEAPQWRLLHGDPDQVRELAATLGVRYRPTGTGQFSHTMRIVLLDRAGLPVEHWDGLSRPLEAIAAAATALASSR